MQTPPANRPDANTLQAAAADAGIQLPDAAIQAFQHGRMIEAIKLVRAANPGLDLARAKAAMEYLQRAQRSTTGAAAGQPEVAQQRGPTPLSRGMRPPTVEKGDPPGQLRWVLIVLGLLAAGFWLAFGGMPG
ncbi:hypothetical protein [Thermomonas carbonis]|uniref:Uncharacterized protein n=1 Tax=Thermomonas carbonis TaxID=1463158 RepID=A0A7G9SRH0_9GAMM|nr:hypothetical protein [Thermomonas carbonis]QNN70445.1 hypothetical protein H9L16_02085 [Thermomonas carbonis]GHC00046.1 hypothetical protein GCM10010080_11380 [Thermomonas carbonis]